MKSNKVLSNWAAIGKNIKFNADGFIFLKMKRIHFLKNETNRFLIKTWEIKYFQTLSTMAIWKRRTVSLDRWLKMMTISLE